MRARGSKGVLAAVVAAASLIGASTSSAQTSSTWSGTWSTDFGAMTLTQSANSVEGTYTHDQGHLTGTVSGNVLSGRWDEVPHAGPSDAGPFQFTMSADGKSFSGTWGYDADTTPTPRPWSGTCTGGACLSTSCSFTPSAPTARASQATTACKTDADKKHWTDLSIEHNERAAEVCMGAAAFAGWALVPGWQAHAGGAAVFASFLCAVEWKLSAMYARWANDPPDPNFTTVALPDTINVPRIKPSKGISKNAAGALNALLRNLADQASYTEALTHAFERSQGAAEASDTVSEDAQRMAASRYATALAGLVPAREGLANRAGAALRASGLGRVAIGRGAVRDVKKRLRKQDFPSTMERMLDRAELSPQDLAALNTTLRKRSPGALSGTSIAALLTGSDLAARDSAAGAAFDGLAGGGRSLDVDLMEVDIRAGSHPVAVPRKPRDCGAFLVSARATRCASRAASSTASRTAAAPR
jgi:hypothetical protein